MKTYIDFEKLKKRKCAPFESMFDYVVAWLSDCYISKSDGVQRIKSYVGHYDREGKIRILRLVERSVKATGCPFDWTDFID